MSAPAADAAPKTVRLAIASFAHMHAHSYLACARALPGVEVAGLFEDDAARRRGLEGKYAEFALFDDLAALLARRPDGIIVCSENARHREHAVAALEAGIPVLCEKPLASRLEDGRAMVETARRRGVRLGTAFPCRFHPAAVRTRALVRAGDIGAVRAVSATNHGQAPPGWFVDPALAGGGALMDHTVHVVDLLRWMTGQEIVSVYAESGTMREGLAVEDLGLVSLRTDGGIIATVDTSWSRPGYFPTWGDVTMEIVGAGGVASLDLFAQAHAVYLARREGAAPPDHPVRWMNWGDEMDQGLVADFVEALREGREPAVTGEDGLRALEVAVAAYESVRTGAPVEMGAP